MKKIIKILLFTIIIFWLGINLASTTNAAANDSTITFSTSTDLSSITNDCTKKTCTIKSWTSAIMNLMWWIIKYATFLVWLLAVLFIVINWIMYSMGWMDQSLKDESKKRIIKTLVWIIVLLMSWVILNFIAPWIYR